VKALHHRFTYHTTSRRLVATANANPATRCWICHNTIDHCRPHHNGRPAYWTAGHINDGEINGALAPECSTCNYSRGAHLTNRHRTRNRTSRNW
jgi:hypothetical protein